MTDTDGLTSQDPYMLAINFGEDVLASLEFCHLSLNHVRENPHSWKWVIIGFHSALQGAMAAHLNGKREAGALVTKDAKALLTAWHDRISGYGPYRPYPNRQRLAPPKELWERMGQIDQRVEDGAGRIIVPNEAQKKAFNKLCYYRNELTHFKFDRYISLHEMPNLLTEICGILQKIDEARYAFTDIQDPQRKRLQHLIQTIPCQARAIGDTKKPRERH